MKCEEMYFNPNDFSNYGTLQAAMITELNNTLKKALEEENIVLNDGDNVPETIIDLISDMRNCPDLYVSASLGLEMGIYASQHNLS